MRQTPLALALGVVFIASAHAETLPEFVGETIVVTPTRTPQKSSQIIGDVTVITSRQISEAGQATLVELLQKQPGVEISQYGGAGTGADIRIRGGNPGHTLVLIDGLRVGSATLGTTPLEGVSLDQIERIEILRGPASSLYGADAVAGVIQIFTRQGKGAPKLSARAGGGSHGLLQGDVQYSGQAGASRFSLGAGYARTDGGFSATRPGTYGFNPDDDGDEKHSAHLRFEHALNPAHSVGLSGLYNRDRVEYDAGTADDYSINHVNSLAAWWRGRLADNWQSRLLIGQGQNRSANYSLGASTGSFDTDQTQYQWQNDFSLPLGELTASLERLEQEVDASLVAFSQTKRTVNAGQIGYRARVGRHALQASLRHDEYSDFGGQTTGMAGYGFDVTPAWRLTASYGTSFKAPTFNDLYYPVTAFFQGNPSLKPEQGRNLELGLGYQQGVNALNVTVYRNRVKDLIVYVFPTMQNVSRATLEGLTLAGHTELAGLRFKASYDWQNAEDDATDKELTYRAQNYGTLDVSRTLGNWEIGAALVASGKRYTNNANTSKLDGYARLDVRANYRMTPEWRLLARVNNALDADYSLRAGYNTPGVNGFVGVEYRQK
ncbi:MAG: TonB-dependent receptor domain-containing protein [Thiobacillus sp.]